MQRSPFESACDHVEAWLDAGAGSRWAVRDTRLRAEKGRAWEIDLHDDELAIRKVRLFLPPDFPASPCELYVDRAYFLKVPHVEADGHLCLGLESIPEDYTDPVAAIARALQALRDRFLEPANDAQWVERQFQEERASYWWQLCISRKVAHDRRPLPGLTYVDLRELDRWSEGTLVGYVPAGAKHRRLAVQVVSNTDVDPAKTATRHRWADGTMVRGDALLVRMPSEHPWTPATWPMTFHALNALIGELTDHECSLVNWLQKAGWSDTEAPRNRKARAKARARLAQQDGNEAPPGQRPLLVVLVQDNLMYGYQLFGSGLALMEAPALEPVPLTRIDPDWALARDHGAERLRERRAKRVLLLGAGSLGSPLAVALAKAGIGVVDIVDSQVMETENTARHVLGMEAVGQSKARALAQLLMRNIPGISARGFLADAATWATKNCKPGQYDLVVECTAESSVRVFMAQFRTALFGSIPVIHAWTEPLCSAGHVVLSQLAVPWPDNDPADDLVNASDLSAKDTRVNLPACSAGFHPYGSADIELVAAFVAQRVIAALDDAQMPSMVWSWVRSSAFFEALPVPVNTRPIVPASNFPADSVSVTRDLAQVLGHP